jgi:hypothetical protein
LLGNRLLFLFANMPRDACCSTNSKRNMLHVLQVGVTVPNSKPDWSSTPEMQRVTVRHNLFGQQRILTLLAPAGNDNVINISVAAADPAVLWHPNLGLNVTVHGSSLPAVVAVADGQQGATAMASMLRQALKLSSSLAVGVEWIAAEDGRSVTYQVAAAGPTNISLVSAANILRVLATVLAGTPAAGRLWCYTTSKSERAVPATFHVMMVQ